MRGHHLNRYSALSIMAICLLAMTACSDSSSRGNKSQFTVSGTVSYQDIEYSSGGLTLGIYNNPVRHANMEVIHIGSDKVLGRGVTTSNGDYSIDIWITNEDSAYSRVIASTSESTAPAVEIRTSPTDGPIYSVAGADFIANTAAPEIASDIVITAAGPAGGAFNILDVYTAAGEFSNTLTGENPPPLTAHWSQGVASGTFFSFLSGDIYITGGSTDTDEYDDDVLWHEYGHFIANAYSIDDTPGGSHSFSDTDLDLRLSWSEGWGSYFPGAIKRWIVSTPGMQGIRSWVNGMEPTYYLDSTDAAPSISMDIAAPGGAPYYHSTNEVAVAKVLLDIDLNHSSASVWEVFSTLGSYIAAGDEATLEAFWDGWESLQGASAITNSILSDRQIYYMDDTLESDDTADNTRLITVDAAGEEHYLYSTSAMADEDYIAFDALVAGDYKIETFCLKNGADTLIEILDTDGASVLGTSTDTPIFVAGSCAPDAYTQYASEITITISTPGIYYIRVTSDTLAKAFSWSPPTFPYTGRYGTYTLSVTKL